MAKKHNGEHRHVNGPFVRIGNTLFNLDCLERVEIGENKIVLHTTSGNSVSFQGEAALCALECIEDHCGMPHSEMPHADEKEDKPRG